MKLSLISALLILAFSFSAQATPGDVGCTGSLGGRVPLEILIGYDNFGQVNPALLELSARGEKIFSSKTPRWGMVNVGTEDEPFMNTVLSAETEDGSYVKIRYPEQDQTADTTMGIMEFTIKGGLRALYVEITCQK